LFVTEIDLINTATSVDEPGFCCLGSDPGGDGDNAVWAKVVAQGTCSGGDNNGEDCRRPADCPNGTCPSTVSIGFSTCRSVGRTIGNTNYPADDSVLQVFTVADPDVGLCGDLSVCSVSLQDCVDHSTCAVTDNRACSSLIPVACNDDYGDACPNAGPGTQPHNSQVCIPDAVVGQTYYAMIAAAPPTTKHCVDGADDGELCTASSQCGNWCVSGANARQPCTSVADCPGSTCEIGLCVDDEHRGVYRLTVNSPCGPPLDLIPNDLCGDAQPLTGSSLSIPFDLTGGVDYDPVTFDCPGPSCLNSLKNDVWFDWIAPANGAVAADTCGGFGSPTPDTALVVYDGCDCPVDITDELSCSDFETSGDCFGGSRVRFNAIKDHCYKFRLGGRDGATDIIGNLNLNLTQCPNGAVTFVNPIDGTVDARQPYAPTTPAVRQGIQDITVTAPPGNNIVDVLGSQGRFACWSLCETALDATNVPNRVANVTDNLNGTFNVRLLKPITPDAVTTVTYTSGDGATVVTAAFTSHPGNADGGPAADEDDVTALLDYLGAIQVPAWGVYSSDMDHSGLSTPADILRVIDVLQGAHSYNVQMDTLLPDICGTAVCCP
jgi:hypothetical protein